MFFDIDKSFMKNGRTYGTTEDTEKDSVSSKRISVKSDTPWDFRAFSQVWWLRAYDLKSRGHRGEGGKKYFTSLKY
jgi:hypothetical protein